MTRNIWALALAFAILALGGGPVLAQTAPAAPAAADIDPARYEDRVLGSPDAPVTIYEYSSLTCPHCASFHANILPDLKREYIDTGRVKLVYRDFPFDRVALGGAMIARCLPPERYFPFIEVLFQDQRRWAVAEPTAARQALLQLARLSGMTQERFDACLSDQKLADTLIERRLDAERQFNVGSTPTFIIGDGTQRIVGAQPITEFRAILDRLAPPRS